MPRIPLLNISMAPQGGAGVNAPDVGLVSDAVGRAIQSAGMDRARGAMAAAEGEMARGKAIAGLGKSVAGVADAFAALGEREKKLDSLESRLSFDQDLQRHYLTREEFEYANSENPVIDGKNQYTEFAIRGIADLKKKYGDMELDPGTAAYIASSLSQHTIKSPAEARINSIKQRGVNFNNQYRTALENNNFDSAYNVNDAALNNGLINKTQYDANKSTIIESRSKFIRNNGANEVSAFLLDGNVTAADQAFEQLQLEGGYTDQEKQFNLAEYENKKANVVIYNTTLNNSLEKPSEEYSKITSELNRRQQPGWKEDPKDPTGLGRLDNVQLEDLKEKVGDIVKTKANEQLSQVFNTLQDVPAGETRDQFNERVKLQAPELYSYDNGAITSFLYDYKNSGKQAQGGITGYFLDKINDIDFEDQSVGAMQERGMILDAIDQFTDGGIKDELKKQWSQREKLHTDPASLPQVKAMEGMVDAYIDALPMPEIPAQEVIIEPARTPWYRFGFGDKTIPPVTGRPGKLQKQQLFNEEGELIGEKEKFVPDTDKSQEEILNEERKTLGNAIKGELRENAANGKYTKEDGTFNTELFRNDFNLKISDINPLTVPDSGLQTTTPEDESLNITPEVRRARAARLRARDSGANVPVPSPEPMEYTLPPVDQLDETFNPSAQVAPELPLAAPQFIVDNRTRDKLESTRSTTGSRIVSLDYNSSSSGGNYAMVVIPNDATSEEREAAELYVNTVTEWYRSNGISVGNPVVKTTGENGRGVGGFFHTEPAFVENKAAMTLLQEKSDEYADILASTLGALPGTRFIPPHKATDPGAGSPDFLSEREFAKAYILPSLEKILMNTADETLAMTGLQSSNKAIKISATAYAPKRGASNVSGAGGEGGYESSRPGPDGQAIVRTLDDVLTGKSDYVTIAGNPELYNKEYIIPEIPYTDKQGVQHRLKNVRAVVHDTGSAFSNKPEGIFDIPVARDATKSVMATNHASWNNIQFIPAEA